MKTMKKLWLLLVIPVFLCSLCIGIDRFIFTSNIGSHPSASIESMLVDVSDFPDGWKVDYVLPITGSNDWGKENIMMGVNLAPEQGYAHQYVYRFHNVFEAMYAQHFLREDLLLIKGNKTDFLVYKSPTANDWIMNCTDTTMKGIWCETLARYDDFIVCVSISAASKRLTPEQLEKVLQSVDRRMEKELMKSSN
jgi:hypothetical protein